MKKILGFCLLLLIPTSCQRPEKDTVQQTAFINLASGNGFSITRDTENKVWVTGENSFGQLGTQDTQNRSEWTWIFSNAKAIFAGHDRSFILDHNNTLYVSGENEGSFGNGSKASHSGFIISTHNITQVAIGGNFSLALDTENRLWTTGVNTYGQLGTGLINDHRTEWTPISVTGNIVKIAAGNCNSIILKSDKTAWAAGCNNYKQLGNLPESNYTFKPIIGVTNIIDVIMGNAWTFLLQENGNLWASGGIGLSDAPIGHTGVNNWTLVLTNVQQVATSSSHSIALLIDGRILATGNNGTNSFKPGEPIIYGQWIEISPIIAKKAIVGHGFTILQTEDNRLYGIGDNGKGQLGTGSNQSLNTWQVIWELN